MATTLASDMKIYEAQFASGRTEKLRQNIDAFNAASGGAILLRSSALPANYEYNSFFKTNGSLISRQDITSDSAVTPAKLTQDENISVKLHRKSVTDLTQKAARMAGISFDEMVFAHGEQWAQEYLTEMLNTALAAARAAIAAQSDVTNDITAAATKTVSHTALLNTLRKFGDQTDSIAAWVMHSTQYFDLGIQSISDDIVNVADGIVRRVEIPGLGRPILVTDSASLIATADTPDSYFVLGLVGGGIDVNESEGVNQVVDNVTGLEQLVVRVQAEYAYNLGLKGFKWDTANGGANPNAATVATATNWDKVATSSKDLAGVVLKCQALADQ
jgi:hypothetical protein